MENLQREYQRMERRHLREKKELQDRIQDLKNEVPKSDKKKRKQLLLDVASLKAELEQKHQQELANFVQLFPDERKLDAVTEGLAQIDLEAQTPRVLKIQKRRERRAASERERQKMAARAEEDYLKSYRQEEVEKLAVILEARNLEMKDIPGDSHCLYRAIQDQLEFSVTVESLRGRTANYMREHVDDFLPFFSHPDTGSPYTLDDFFTYCDNIAHSTQWGSQLELRALSHILQAPIEVIQTEAPVIVIGEEYTRKPLTIVYMRYASTFGEHYNSVKPLEAGAVGGAALGLF